MQGPFLLKLQERLLSGPISYRHDSSYNFLSREAPCTHVEIASSSRGCGWCIILVPSGKEASRLPRRPTVVMAQIPQPILLPLKMSALSSTAHRRGAALLAASRPILRTPLLVPRTRAVPVFATAAAADVEAGRLRLNNLAPQPGSRRPNKRKGRGHAAGQGASCGFGMRGQKSRSGSGVRPGFEGGQNPLYRRLPKLRGIAGGMPAGVPKYVTINVGQLAAFKEGEVVSLHSAQEKGLFKASGYDARLPLKVLGDGDLIAPLTIEAEAFSQSAREKIEKAGGKIVELPGKVTWTRAIGRQRAREAAAAAAKAPKVKKSAPEK